MCGIAGIIQLDQSPCPEKILREMSFALAHRGPDGDGIYIDGSVGLAHRRLSIIDIEGGTQPLSNEDGSVWISYNGEIYNFEELRRRLISQGHIFKSRCDTEVIIHLYEEHGPDCVSLLHGMFSFAIWDSRKRLVMLARDRLGQKPLFYCRDGRHMVFASELQAIEKHPGLSREIDRQALHDYFSLQYIPAPRTIYRAVRKLPPAHFLLLDVQKRSARLQRYWTCRYDHKFSGSYEEAKERLRDLIQDAVRGRLMSDVPLGAFLSGGVDSGITVGIMSELCGQAVKTFTVGFKENRYDERSQAAAIAERFGTEHRERIVEADDFAAVEKLVRHYGEPYSDASMLPTFLLSRFTRENVTVALSGDGADEIFGGYNRYLALKSARFADICPPRLRRKLCHALSRLIPPKTEERSLSGVIQRLLSMVAVSPEERYSNLVCRFDEDGKRGLYGERMSGVGFAATSHYFDALMAAASSVSPVEQVMEMELHSYLPGDILTKVDIASMACSLEVRSPFLDHRVAEFAAALPFSWKIHGRHRKHILVDSFRDFLPKPARNRGKRGFGVPLADWFRGSWAEIIRERLLDGHAVRERFFRGKLIEELLDEHRESRADHSYALWAMLIFELWLERNS